VLSQRFVAALRGLHLHLLLATHLAQNVDSRRLRYVRFDPALEAVDDERNEPLAPGGARALGDEASIPHMEARGALQGLRGDAAAPHASEHGVLRAAGIVTVQVA